MKTCPQCGAEYELDAQFCLKDGATLRSEVVAPNLEGTILADRYRVLRKLGEGGMGQVYLAEHVRIKRRSALKVVKPDLATDPQAIARFNREAANASRIDHPNVAAIYDFGETPDGMVYLAMEYVDGEPLSRAIERAAGRRLPPRRVAGLVAQAAEALAAAHELGIVHRDVKPDNIMVARHRDGSDRVKVVDFGLSKMPTVVEQKVTFSGAIVGTPAFMSPEQVRNEPLDGRSDVYSLALAAFAALTGSLPFAADSTQEMMAVRLTEPPRTLAEVRPDVRWPAPVQAVFARALAVPREARFHDVTAFAESLTAAVAMMPPELPDDDSKTGVRGAALRSRDFAPSAAERATHRPAAPAGSAGAAVAQRSRRRTIAWVVAGSGAAALALAAVGYAVTRTRAEAGHRAASSPAADTPGAPGAAGNVRGGDSARWRMPVVDPTKPPPKQEVAGMDRKEPTQADPPGPRSEPTPPSSGSMDSAAAVLRRVAELTNPQSPDDSLREALRLADGLLPRLTSRSDSVRLLYGQAAAHAFLGDRERACDRLAPLRRLAPGTPFEEAVSVMFAAQSCR